MATDHIGIDIHAEPAEWDEIEVNVWLQTNAMFGIQFTERWAFEPSSRVQWWKLISLHKELQEMSMDERFRREYCNMVLPVDPRRPPGRWRV